MSSATPLETSSPALLSSLPAVGGRKHPSTLALGPAADRFLRVFYKGDGISAKKGHFTSSLPPWVPLGSISWDSRTCWVCGDPLCSAHVTVGLRRKFLSWVCSAKVPRLHCEPASIGGSCGPPPAEPRPSLGPTGGCPALGLSCWESCVTATATFSLRGVSSSGWDLWSQVEPQKPQIRSSRRGAVVNESD